MSLFYPFTPLNTFWHVLAFVDLVDMLMRRPTLTAVPVRPAPSSIYSML